MIHEGTTLLEHHYVIRFNGAFPAHMRLEESTVTGQAFFMFVNEWDERTRGQIRKTLHKRTIPGGRVHVFPSRQELLEYLSRQGWECCSEDDPYYYCVQFDRPLYDPASLSVIFE